MLADRFDFSSLSQRFLSAAVLIPIVLVVMYFGGWPFILLLLAFAGVSLWEWIHITAKFEGHDRYIYAALGFVYVLVSFCASYFIYSGLGFYWSIIFIVMVWGSDSGAYFVGKAIGGAKLLQSVSPNKTWAGFVGALVTPLIIGFVGLFLYRGVDGFLIYDAAMVACAGLLVGFAGQVGDLMISALKRKAGVKDSGAIIPGHGGVLDRIDSMMLAAPVYLLFMMSVFHGF